MEKIKIESVSSVADDEISHLAPVIKFIIDSGNKPVMETWSSTPNGLCFYFKKPIDFKILSENFEFPESIKLSEEFQQIFDERGNITIFGDGKRSF